MQLRISGFVTQTYYCYYNNNETMFCIKSRTILYHSLFFSTKLTQNNHIYYDHVSLPRTLMYNISVKQYSNS